MLPIPIPRLPSSGQANSTMRMIAGWLSMPWDVLLRHSYGPAYFSLLRLLGFLFALWLYIRITGFRASVDLLIGYGSIGDGQSSPLLPILGLLVTIGTVLQLRRMARNAQTTEMIYPDSIGISHLYLGNNRYRFDYRLPGAVKLSHWRVYRFVDPLLAFGIATIFWMFDGEFGGFLMLSAFANFVRNQMVFGSEQEELFSWQRRRIRHGAFEIQLQEPNQARELHEYNGYVPLWLPPAQRQAFAQDQIAQQAVTDEMPEVTLDEEPDDEAAGITQPHFARATA